MAFFGINSKLKLKQNNVSSYVLINLNYISRDLIKTVFCEIKTSYLV